MTEIKTVKSFLHKNISDDTVRYLTCHNQAHNFWFAKKQVVTDDKWRTCWTSSEYANQLGARNAIKYYLGV